MVVAASPAAAATMKLATNSFPLGSGGGGVKDERRRPERKKRQRESRVNLRWIAHAPSTLQLQKRVDGGGGNGGGGGGGGGGDDDDVSPLIAAAAAVWRHQ